MRSRLYLSSAAIALMLAAPAFAQQPGGHSPTAPSATAPAAVRLSQADMKFIHEAAMGGMAEVEIGRVAERNAQNPQVKQFGARMVKDHDAANAQLTAIATGKGATLPQNVRRRISAASLRCWRIESSTRYALLAYSLAAVRPCDWYQ